MFYRELSEHDMRPWWDCETFKEIQFCEYLMRVQEVLRKSDCLLVDWVGLCSIGYERGT